MHPRPILDLSLAVWSPSLRTAGADLRCLSGSGRCLVNVITTGTVRGSGRCSTRKSATPRSPIRGDRPRLRASKPAHLTCFLARALHATLLDKGAAWYIERSNKLKEYIDSDWPTPKLEDMSDTETSGSCCQMHLHGVWSLARPGRRGGHG